MRQHRVYAILRTCNRAVDTFGGQQQRAPYPVIAASLQQGLSQSGGIVKANEIVKRGHADGCRSIGISGFHGQAFSLHAIAFPDRDTARPVVRNRQMQILPVVLTTNAGGHGQE